MWVIAKPKSKTQFVKASNNSDYGTLQEALMFDLKEQALSAITEKGEIVYKVERVYKLKKV